MNELEHELLQRLPDETPVWHSRFMIYYEIGVTRSVQKVFHVYLQQEGKEIMDRRGVPKNAPGKWYMQFRKHRWEERALKADAAVRSVRIKAKREEYEKQLDDVTEKGLARVNEMLSFPVAEKRVVKGEDGKTEIHIHPAKWRFRDAVQMLSILAKINGSRFGIDFSDTINLKVISGQVTAEEETEFIEALQNNPKARKAADDLFMEVVSKRNPRLAVELGRARNMENMPDATDMEQ